ncbi:MAG: hypothetical protein VB120_04970 [Lachnospiraceae bacterium]|nr:hypothetical protein [Lachnospiraceae bacterium]
MDIKFAKGYIESFLRIKTKENKIEYLNMNEPQLKLYNTIKAMYEEKKPVRIIILKARQMGFSTLTEAVIFHRTATKENVNSLIIAHKEEATTNLFNMSKLFYEELPEILKPMKKASNAKELIFENPTSDTAEKKKKPGLRSKIKCATAGGIGVGRSDTLSNVHASEYAFWEGDKKSTLNGLMQAVPQNAETMVIIESTANGYEEFKELWDMAVCGENDFVPLFFPWFMLGEYKKEYTGFEFTDYERKLMRLYLLTPEQISWRRWCIKNNCGGDETLFKQEYPSSPEEAFITTGNSVFSKENIIKRIEDIKAIKFEKGLFSYGYDGMKLEDITWVPGDEGFIAMFKEPVLGSSYILGGDTAGEGSDYFTAHVLDLKSGEQVAVFHGKTDEDIYVKQIYSLGKHYNNAYLAIESNFSTYPVRELSRLGYTNQYVRENVDRYIYVTEAAFGFKTTAITRPLIIASLVAAVREDISFINHRETLLEMLTFIKNPEGRAQAAASSHDDLVMGLAIAFFIRSERLIKKGAADDTKSNWTNDMWEDYNNADDEGKEYLLKKWRFK